MNLYVSTSPRQITNIPTMCKQTVSMSKVQYGGGGRWGSNVLMTAMIPISKYAAISSLQTDFFWATGGSFPGRCGFIPSRQTGGGRCGEADATWQSWLHRLLERHTLEPKPRHRAAVTEAYFKGVLRISRKSLWNALTVSLDFTDF